MLTSGRGPTDQRRCVLAAHPKTGMFWVRWGLGFGRGWGLVGFRGLVGFGVCSGLGFGRVWCFVEFGVWSGLGFGRVWGLVGFGVWLGLGFGRV
jgi:hypothetical protein